jgi:uncharacterized membrane protein
MFLMSFLTLGIFWTGQQTQLSYFARSNRALTWIQIGLLAAASTMPFSTSPLGEFITYRTALLLSWGNILLLGAALYGSWVYANRAGLLRDGTPPEVSTAITRRIAVAQTLYAIAALLCLISTYWSIA